MAGIFSKVRSLLLSNIHGLLDKAIDLNSIEAIKQHIRDLEDAIEGVEDSAIMAQGDRKTASDEVKRTEAAMAELEGNINFILGDGDDANDHLAEPLVNRLMDLEETLKTQREVEAAHQTNLVSLEEVVSRLRSKHALMLNSINALEAKKRVAGAKSKAADAIKQATALGSNTPSIDNVAGRINRDANIADAKLGRAMGDFKAQSADPVRDAQVAARLAAMKAAKKAAM